MDSTRKLIAGGVLAAGLMVGAAALVVGAGVAHAAPVGEHGPFSGPSGDQSGDAYWVDLQGHTDMTGSMAEATKLGRWICTSLRSGQSEGQLISSLASGDGTTVNGFTFVVHAAEWHFCPEKY
jgi:hypothetical protein